MSNTRKKRMRVERPFKYYFMPPPYSLPLEIGCFSIDSKGKYRDDGHQMKYLSMPDRLTNLHMDLNEGFDEYIDLFEDTDYEYQVILKWILIHQDQVRDKFMDRFSSSPKIDFVFFRSILLNVSSVIYEKNEDLLIYATKFRSVIYLVLGTTERTAQLVTKRKDLLQTRREDMPQTEREDISQTEREDIPQTEGKAEEDAFASEKHLRALLWGFKFEQHMVSDAPHLKPVTSVPVNENEKYFSVMKGKLRNHSFLFTAEIDGVDPKYFTFSGHDPTSVLRYIELKTSKILTSERQKRTFNRYKLLKWFLQSYLVGIPRVICGFRDDEGIVRKVGVYNVRDMPEIAGGSWSKEACLNFCSQFLENVKRWVNKDDPKVVYEIYWRPGSDIVCEELDSDDSDDCRFLPEWYINQLTAI